MQPFPHGGGLSGAVPAARRYVRSRSPAAGVGHASGSWCAAHTGYPRRCLLIHSRTPTRPFGAGQGGSSDLFWRFSACLWARRDRRRGQGSTRQGRPRSGRRSLTPTPGGARCSGRRRIVSVRLRSVPVVSGRVRAPAPVPRLVDRPRGGLSVIPSLVRHGVLRQVRGGRGQSRGATTPCLPGVMTDTTRAHRGLGVLLTPPACGRWWTGGGRGRHAARRRPARSARGRRRRRRCCGRGGRRPGRGSARGGCAPGTRCTASTAAQRTSRLPCLVIRPRCTVVSDSWCFGVSPAQRGQLLRAGRKRLMSPISATNTAASTGPTPGMGWIAR